VTGLQFGSGRYKIAGLPEGQYLVEIQQISSRAVGGSSIGPLDRQIPLPVLEQYYNGPDGSSTSPSIFVPVTVSPGNTTSGIDIVLSGLNTAALTVVNEVEPNENSKKGQRVNSAVEITGSAAGADEGRLKLTLPDGSIDPVEDIYRFTVAEEKLYFILLEPEEGSNGDLDIYLFDTSLIGKKKASIRDSSVLASSAGPTANEVIVLRLAPGVYSLGLSAFEQSNVRYKLRIIPAQ
jgi:hypothetical protein